MSILSKLERLVGLEKKRKRSKTKAEHKRKKKTPPRGKNGKFKKR